MFLLVLHGNDAFPEDVFDLAPRLAPGHAWEAPQAPFPFSFGHAWRLPGGDLSHLETSRKLVRDRLRAAREAHGIDSTRTVVVGFSRGASVALDALVTLPDDEAPALAISFGGFLDADTPDVARPGRRALLVHGREDEVVPPAEAEKAHARLVAMGIASTLRVVGGEHEITEEMAGFGREAIAQLRTERLRKIVDDVLTERNFHRLEPRIARDLQLAASAVNHDRFRRLLGELARLLEGA